MPATSSTLLVIYVSIALCTIAAGAPILDDLFSGFIRDSQLANTPAKDSPVVKRRVYDNPDASLKQVSLQSLIGDVEDSLFQSALSVSDVAYDHEAVVPEVKVPTEVAGEREIKKRQTDEGSNQNGPSFATSTEAGPDAKNILLQTSQKVPAADGVPAHVLIDRITVQPHEGGIPLIPAFQVYHTKVTTGPDANKGGATKISIAQTAVQTTNAAGVSTVDTVPVVTITTDTKPNSQSTTTTTTTAVGAPISTQTVQDKSSTSTSSATTETTTKLPLVQLKEAEDQLKEKVAEIEAEPVILTARV